MTNTTIFSVLVAGGLLAVVFGPVVVDSWESGKRAHAEFEVLAIREAVFGLARDTARFPLYTNGAQTAGDPEIELLRGPGNDPEDHETDRWLTSTRVGELEDHLITNNPGAVKYATSGRFPWRGPYLATLSADPWGNRYLLNIKNANPADNPAKVVWILSAGPNGKIETDPAALVDANPEPGGDDIAIRIK
jgi:hypothetical protein